MVLIDILSKLIANGSDRLVHALYQRLRTDRAGGSASLLVDHPVWSWREIADQAMAEGLLPPREAGLLRALISWPDAPVPAGPASLRAVSARRSEASGGLK